MSRRHGRHCHHRKELNAFAEQHLTYHALRFTLHLPRSTLPRPSLNDLPRVDPTKERSQPYPKTVPADRLQTPTSTCVHVTAEGGTAERAEGAAGLLFRTGGSAAQEQACQHSAHRN